MGEHSGFIKDSTGNLYKVNAAGTVSAIKTGTDLTVTERPNIPTSKGFYASEIVRVAPVEVSRLGKAVRTVAAAAGPIGLTVSAVSLVCELTAICDQAGQWFIQGNDPMPGAPSSYPASDGKWVAWGDRFTYSPEAACGDTQRIETNVGPTSTYVYDHIEQLDLNTYKCFVRHIQYGSIFYASNTARSSGCPSGYALQGSDCVKTGVTESHAATAADWDAKESLLNDSRFIDPLLEKGSPVPVSAPQITTPVKVPLGSETKTMKDGTGNVTGTETTITEAEISQPSGSENPTGSPSLIKITENTTVNNYNTSNQLTSSTTTVSSTQTPVQTQQEPITISIDNVPDQELQTYAVPGTFSFTSWGSGSCPADKTWNTMFGTQAFSYQLTCDFATTFKPILLLIAAIVSFMIVASTRTE
jgi:hypothetical protein